MEEGEIKFRSGCKPSYYDGIDSDITCIDAIRAMLGSEGFAAYLKGTMMAYMWRAGRKTRNGTEDIDKINANLEFLREQFRKLEGCEPK